MADAAVDEAASLAPAASLFHSLSDPARLAILRHLALGEHRVVDLTAHLRLAQSTVSAHLACLRECDLVTSRPQGRASLFSLTHPEELMDLLGAAERLLVVTGDAVDLCPTHGSGGTARTTHDTTHDTTHEAAHDGAHDGAHDAGPQGTRRRARTGSER